MIFTGQPMFLNVRFFHHYFLKAYQNSSFNLRFIFCFIGFSNAKTGDIQRDEYKHLLVSRESEAIPFEPNRALEDTVYKGYQNSLFYIRRYEGRIS